MAHLSAMHTLPCSHMYPQPYLLLMIEVSYTCQCKDSFLGLLVSWTEEPEVTESNHNFKSDGVLTVSSDENIRHLGTRNT